MWNESLMSYIHTFIIGTSKTYSDDAWYFQNWPKFWRDIKENIAPMDDSIKNTNKENRDYLAQNYGILFTDIVHLSVGQPQAIKDDYITYSQLTEGVTNLNHLIHKYSESLRHIAFVGKKACEIFLLSHIDELRFDGKEKNISIGNAYKERKGKLPSGFWIDIGSRLDLVFLTSHAHGQYKTNMWCKFWKWIAPSVRS